MIEMRDLLPESEIFQERGASLPGFQRVLIVRDDDALIGRKPSLGGLSGLMGGASRSGDKVFLRIAKPLKAFRLACFCHLKRAPADQLRATTPGKGIRAASLDD